MRISFFRSWNTLFIVAFTQGFPLLFSLIVYIIDKYGDCSLILPKMGHAQCFLGDMWSQQSNRSDTFVPINQNCHIYTFQLMDCIFYKFRIHLLPQHPATY